MSQELFMLFLKTLIDKFDPSFNIEPYLIQAGRNVALSLSRKQKEILFENDHLQESEDADINSSNSIMEEVPVLPHEQETAMEKIRMAFPGVFQLEVPARRGNPAKTKEYIKERGKSERKLSETCNRLRNIRIELAISQEAFASRLGIPTATLLSYEYGRTPHVPDRVIEEAERIYKLEKTAAKRNAALADRDMKDIVAEWADKLGVDPTDTNSIAEAIGVANSTVYRWIHGEMKPRPRELGAYMRQIEILARRLERATP